MLFLPVSSGTLYFNSPASTPAVSYLSVSLPCIASHAFLQSLSSLATPICHSLVEKRAYKERLPEFWGTAVEDRVGDQMITWTRTPRGQMTE